MQGVLEGSIPISIRPSARMCRIDVLLATFNGAVYLPALLASVESQTHTDWQLIVSDDGSSDATLDILNSWSSRNPGRMQAIKNNEQARGACKNFAALLETSDAPYFMFCDQDDVWLSKKLELFCQSMREIEAQRGSEMPILIHSDLIVVDRELQQIAPSFWRYQRLMPRDARLNPDTLMLANYVTGCASMGNAALRQIARPIPGEAAMHDWWLALVAANLGELRQIRTPTVLYRQHANNQIGARSWSFSDQVTGFLRTPEETVRRMRAVIERTQRQAAAFADRFDGRVDRRAINRFRSYSRLRGRSFHERKAFMVTNRIWPHYWIRSAAMWWFM